MVATREVRSVPICSKPARESKAVESDLKSVRVPPQAEKTKLRIQLSLFRALQKVHYVMLVFVYW